MFLNIPRQRPRSLDDPPAPLGTQKFVRSGQMINCLRQHLLYSEKRARDYVFDAVEDLLSGPGQRITLNRLIREAVSRARRRAEAAGYEFAAWETATRAVVNSMLRAGALLAPGGAAIQPGVAAHASEVHTVAPDYRDLTESFLLEFLIRGLGDVKTRDHTALAHALFRQFDPNIPVEDLEDRVVALLARLAGRIVLTDDGVYAVGAAAVASLY